MTKEILINHLPMQTRLAVVQDGVLDEIYIESRHQMGQVGCVYLGTVVRVLAGMQAVFVNIGLSRTAFLHIDDVKRTAQQQGAKMEQLFHQSERILVQVIKDEIGDKGVRLTTDIALTGRYVVYRPFDAGVGLSSRIKPQQERQRLKQLLSALMADKGMSGGIVVRKAAAGVDASSLGGDLAYLYQQWQVMRDELTSAKTAKKKHQLIHQESSLPLRYLKECSLDGVQIWVDDEQMYRAIRAWIEQVLPSHLPQVIQHTQHKPLFDRHGIERQIGQALSSRVDLPSGGYLVIDQTEAMATIDVNTGANVGKHSPKQTIYQTNLEAATAIARQIRLRQLGGIIILDFIDMAMSEHQDAVLSTLKHELSQDKTPTNIMSISPLGLVEMARKRTQKSLAQQLCQPCAVCLGTGMTKSSQTIAFEIVRKLIQMMGQTPPKPMTIDIFANQAVVDYLTEHEQQTMQQLEQTLNARIHLAVAHHYHLEQYAISHH